MTEKEKALIILEKLDKVLQINWAMEKQYVNAIVEGLKEVEKK